MPGRRRSLPLTAAALAVVASGALIALSLVWTGPRGSGALGDGAGRGVGAGEAGLAAPRPAASAVLPSSAAGPSPVTAASLRPIASVSSAPSATPSPTPSRRSATSTAAVPSGALAQYELPAPWVGGTSPWANIWVYTPAGYVTSNARYPVLYEVPWGADGWEAGTHVHGLLDALIANGTLSPSVVVFVNQAGGPYRPSECADSWDGREHFDTFVASTVVAWVDAHFRTLRTPLARTLIGFSQGGYCAPTLLFHHPDVFGNAVSFSGYYVAGIWSPETRLAYRPFGGDASLIADDSPLVLAERLPRTVRRSLFLVLVGTPGEPFFGPQLTTFAAALSAGGYRFVELDSVRGHSWAQVRAMLPSALQALTQHQRQAGLFNPPGG